MCLVTEQKEPKIAKEPIKVYKVLKREINWPVFNELYSIDNEAPMLHSSFYNHRNFTFHPPYNPEYEYVFGVNVPEEKFNIPSRKYPICGEVSYGWLHAYLDVEDAYQLGESLVHEFGVNNLIVVEMEIPTGASYYAGIEGKEICSDKLVWNKI